jgi:hypothetical protein
VRNYDLCIPHKKYADDCIECSVALTLFLLK